MTFRKGKYQNFIIDYVPKKPQGVRVLATLLSAVENKPEIHFYVTLYTCPIIIKISSIEIKHTNNYKIAAGLDKNSMILIQQKNNERFEVIEYIENMSKAYITLFNYY